MNQKYMELAIEEAKKAYKKDEVPVGCVIVCDGKVIAKSYNTRERNNSVLDHAEINAIKKASKKKNTWKLDDCEMYVTLKPCSMCESIIKQSRIKNVYYLIDKFANKKEYYGTKFEQMGFANDYAKLLSDFFENKRKKQGVM